MRRLPNFRVNTLLLAGFVFLAALMAVDVARAELPYVAKWTRLMGTQAHDQGDCIGVDQSGNSYIAGRTYGSITGYANAGSADVFVAKYGSDGTKRWACQLGSAGLDTIKDITVNSDGVLYVAGYTDNALEGFTNSAPGYSDIILIKYDTNGTRLWTRQYGSSATDRAFGVCTDSAGYIYVVGQTSGALDGQVGTAGINVFISKFNENGTRLWTKLLGNANADEAYGVTVDADENIYIVGKTYGSIDGSGGGNRSRAFIAKLDLSGTLIWARYPKGWGDDAAYGVDVDSSGNVYITGDNQGGLDGTSAWEGDYFVIKYDPSGNQLWALQEGSTQMELARDITVTDDQYVYVAGTTWGALPGNAKIGISDLFLAKYDVSGSHVWTSQRGTVGADIASGVSPLSSNVVYLAGYTNGNLDGATNSGVNDAYVTKMVLHETDQPTSAITDPLDGATLPVPLENYTLHGTADDGTGAGVEYVDVSTDGGSTWHRTTGVSTWSYTWVLPMNGTYNLMSRASDHAGNVEALGAGIDVTVDNPPMTTILMPADLEAVPPLGNYSITGATVDRGGLGIQKVEVSTDSGNTWNIADDGSDDSSWNWWSYQWAPPALGTYTIKARGTDNGGRVEPVGTGVTVIVDGTAPSSAITYPSDGMTLPTALQNYTIRGTADDGWGSGIDYVDISTDGGSTWNRAQGAASWSYAWEGPVNGTYNLISRSTDVFGYVETTGPGITVTVDRPPVSTIIMPVEMEAIPVSLGNYSITGATVDTGGLGIQKVEVSTDSGNTWNDAVDGSGDGSWSWWSYQWAPLPLGTYTIKAKGTDNGGTVEPVGSGVTVIVDGDPPTSLITDPLDGAFIELSVGTYIITGTADDGTGGGVAYMEVSTDGGSTWHPAPWLNDGNGGWSYDWVLQETGSYNILGRATDRAGYVETPGPGLTVTVQNTSMESLWTRQLGTAGTDQAMAVVTDSSGNVYSVGYTGGDMDGNTSYGGADIFISKYDAGGNKLWTRQLGSSSYDYAMGVTIDRDRNVYVIGYSGGDFDGNANSGGSDILVAKYDTNGNKIWSKLLGTENAETGRAISVDFYGMVYVAGYVYNAGLMDYYGIVYRLEPDGDTIWTSTLGEYGFNERIYGIAVDSNSAAYVTGCTDGEFAGYLNAGETDIFVAKISVDGDISWVRQLGCSASDVAYGISLDHDGLFITGETYGDLDGNVNMGEFDPFGGGYTSDAFLVKYDLDGNKIWSRQTGTPGTDKAYGVSSDGEGCAYLVGKTDMGMDGNAGAGGYDLFLTKYNKNGLKLWTAQIGTTGTDQAYGVSLDGNGNAYLTGGTYGDLNGNTNAGSYDMFVAKFGDPLSSYITDPWDGAIINTASYTVTGLAFDYSGTGIQTVDVTTDGGNTWNTASDTSGTGSWATWEYLWTPPPLGNYTIRSRATDLSANIETPGIGATVTVDQEKPSSTINPALDGRVVRGTSLFISGTSGDGAGTGVVLVEVSTDGGSSWNPATGTVYWSYVWALPSDGQYSIKSRATDLAGNVEEAGSGVLVTVDNTPPSSSMTDPADGAAINGAGYTATGTAGDGAGSGVYSVMVSTNGGTNWNAATDTSGDSSWSTWEYAWILPADGIYNLRTRAQDVAGNTETPGAGASVTVDNTPPTSAITDPADGAYLGGSLYAITGNAADALSGVQGVEVSTDGGSNWSPVTDTSGDGSWTTWSYDWTLPGEGVYTLLSRAADAASNVETPGTGISVSVDATPPVTSIGAPAGGVTLGGASFTIAGTGTDGMSGVQSVEVSLDGGATWSSAAYSSGIWSYDWSFASNGEYNIRSRGTDAVGNMETPGPGINVTVFNRNLNTPELVHIKWDEWLTAANCNACHAVPSTFLPADFRQRTDFCRSCHNATAPAHDRNLQGSREHPVFSSVTGVGCVMPTYGNITSAEWDNRMFANLYDTDKVVCITCHNPFKKTEDVGRVWEYTTTSDSQTYSLQNGGWSGSGYFVPVVYRDMSLWTGPAYVKDKQALMVAPSEYTYDETAGTVSFLQAQDPAAYVYVTLDYPYLRASSFANRLCSDCHVQQTHMGANCLTCHEAHNTDNLGGMRGVIRTTDRSERAVAFVNRSGANSFADGDATYDGICEVCHTQTRYHRRDGSGFTNHSSGVDQSGSDCTSCHSHESGFAK